MDPFIIYGLKTIITSAVLFGYYFLVLKEKTFHHYNRFYLLFTVIISLALPLLKVSYFTVSLNPDFFRVIQKIQFKNSIQKTSYDHLFITLIFLAVGSVALYKLIYFSIGIIKISLLKRKYKKEKINEVNFYVTDLDDAPFTFFKNLFWKKSIFIHSDLGQQILKHEMVHIEQNHTVDKIFIEVITSIFWFNPIFWLIKKELNIIHEYLADHQSLQYMDTKAFAQMLLASHFSGKVIPATSPLFSSNLKKRLQMLQKPKTKFGYAHRIFALPLFFTMVFAYLVNAKNEEINQLNHSFSELQSKKDTISQKSTAVAEPNSSFNFEERLAKATDKSLFLINGEEVSKKEYLKYIAENSSKKLIKSYHSLEGNEHLFKEFGVLGPYGEFEKYGVFQVDDSDLFNDNIDKYHKIQQKYAPEWKNYLQNLEKPENRAKLDRILAEKEKALAKADAALAKRDLEQAKLDAKQAKADAEQARIDAEQAVIDAKNAQQHAKEVQNHAKTVTAHAKIVEAEILETKKATIKAIAESKNAIKDAEYKTITIIEKSKGNATVVERNVKDKNAKLSYDGKVKPQVFLDGVEVEWESIKDEKPENIEAINLKKSKDGITTIYIITKKNR